MTNEFNKLLKCLTSKYRSLCDEDYSNITLDKESESLCCKKKYESVDGPSNSSQNKKQGNKLSDSSFQTIKSVLGLKLRHPTKHLDRQQEVKDLCQAVGQPENRYTNFPFGTKKYRSRSFDETHVYVTNNTRTFTNPGKVFVNSPTPPRNNQGLLVSSKSSLVKSLKRRKLLREKSKSDNALQKHDIRCISGSETALHALCTGITCRGISYEPSNLNEYRDRLVQQLPGFATPGTSRRPHFDRQDDLHIYHPTFPANPAKERRTRSLERNYKFTVAPVSPKCPSPCTSSISSKPVITSTSGSLLSTHTTLIYKNKDRTVTLAIQEGRPQLCIDGEAVVTEMPRSREGDSSTRSTGNFINKPARGWLHPDQIIAGDGICYGVRYIGNLAVNTSMKSLDFDTRSLIAKECLHRICEAAGMKTVDKKRKVDKRITKMLGENPNMKNAGVNVTLRITGSKLTLSQIETGEPVTAHEMSNISFASGGDPDTLDFVAYVAKDGQHARACFVLECGGGLAQDVITTIGQAFELRFKEYLKSAPRSQYAVDSMIASASTSSTAASTPVDDPEYYNDMPGKVPPDITGMDESTLNKPKAENAVQPSLPSMKSDVSRRQDHPNPSNKDSQLSVDNLIDLSNEAFVIPTISSHSTHDYVNNVVVKSMARQTVPDPFDMQPFSTAMTTLTDNSQCQGGVQVKLLPVDQRLHLHQEDWFHGPISRREAEALLLKDGDFLVRESQGSPGQYVLTGMHAGCKRHLLLVDPQGIVRTKERTFDSVSHLISYHQDNCLPIISAESALVLRTPILACKTHPSR